MPRCAQDAYWRLKGETFAPAAMALDFAVSIDLSATPAMTARSRGPRFLTPISKSYATGDRDQRFAEPRDLQVHAAWVIGGDWRGAIPARRAVSARSTRGRTGIAMAMDLAGPQDGWTAAPPRIHALVDAVEARWRGAIDMGARCGDGGPLLRAAYGGYAVGAILKTGSAARLPYIDGLFARVLGGLYTWGWPPPGAMRGHAGSVLHRACCCPRRMACRAGRGGAAGPLRPVARRFLAACPEPDRDGSARRAEAIESRTASCGCAFPAAHGLLRPCQLSRCCARTIWLDALVDTWC